MAESRDQVDGPRVLLAPWLEGNQYLDLLTAALERQGIDVERSTITRPFAPLLLDALRADADVFHLHWTHVYFLLGDYDRLHRLPLMRYVCAVFACVFLLQMYLVSLACDRVVWTVHNECNHERHFESLDRWTSRRLVSLVDAVQVWDEHTKRRLADYLDVSTEKMVAIPHGNYLPYYPESERPDRETARDELDLPAEKRIVLYFGMIRPYKQVPSLLDTWADIDPDDAHLVVAGNARNDQLAKRVRTCSRARDDVTLTLEYVPDDEVPTYFAACDLAVFPYEHIFSSGSVVLAMSLARPFVAPNRGAIPSLDPGGNVVYDDLETGLLDGLRLDRSTLDRIGERNAEVARTDLDWDRIAERMESVYVGA